MILLIGKDNEVERFIDESKFSELGIWERTHMEEWISKYPEILGEELLTITTEYDKFDKTENRLDILAIDKNGKLVIIELKRDVADKFVDLQAIHYAAYCSTLNLEQITDIMTEYKKESKETIENVIKDFITNEEFSDFDDQPRIILVANDYREETLAAVLWLRNNDIDITCVKLEPYKLEDKIAIRSQIIIPLPEAKDYMIQVEEKKKKSAKFTLRQQEYKKFWDELVIGYAKEDPNFKVKNPYQQSWLWYGAGKAGIYYSWRFGDGNFTIELYMQNPEVEKNDYVFSELRKNREELEDKLGELLWYNPKDKKLRFIRLKNGLETDIMELTHDKKLELIKWGIEQMLKFKATLQPLLQEISF